MSFSVAQIAVFASVAAYFVTSAAMALRAGRVALYVRYSSDLLFSRGGSPYAYWLVVGIYLLLATGCAASAAVLSLALY